jgi:hypothetical protein
VSNSVTGPPGVLKQGSLDDTKRLKLDDEDEMLMADDKNMKKKNESLLLGSDF